MSRPARERFAIELDGPYDLEATVGFLHGPDDPVVRREASGRVRAAVRTPAGPALVSLAATSGRLDVEVVAGGARAIDEAVLAARRLAGLPPPGVHASSHADFLERARTHAHLADVVGSCEGLRIPQRTDAVTAMVSAVASQLVTTSFAATVTGAILRAHGDRVELDGDHWLVPPSAERLASLSVDDLRRHQLTRKKAEYVIALCGELVAGSLDLHALGTVAEAEATKQLVARRGVGPTTAAWLLMFGAGHADAWPPADVGLLRALGRLRGGRAPVGRGILRVAEPFAGLRTHLALALWQHQRVTTRCATPDARTSDRPRRRS